MLSREGVVLERDVKSPFGLLLKRYRLAAGLSQEALAERARVSTQGVSALERGARRTPQRETLVLLADALDLSSEDRARLVASAVREMRRFGPRTTRAKTPARDPLPSFLASFHGGDREIAALADAIGRHRLVTVTGTGGVGKTRLAVEAAQRVASEFAGGVYFVELAAVASGALVGHRTAEAIGAQATSPATAAAIADALRAQPALVIFDTCEHVLAETAGLIATLLRDVPDLRVLATSRQAFGIAGETVRVVRSLDDAAAIDLFVARARAAHDAFELTGANVDTVAEICRRVDGIPLAIELVAPRTAAFSLRSIAALLDERFRVLAAPAGAGLPRQQTMRAVLDWSHALLDERERRVFRRLGAFVDGWTYERARSACADDELSAWDVLDALSALVAKSLVVVDEHAGVARYRLLESTRAYALELLDASGERDEVMRRLGASLAADARAWRALWEALDHRAWREAIAAERETIRSVIDGWLAGDAIEPGLALLTSIADPGMVFERNEIRRWYEHGARVVDRSDDRALAAAFAHGYARLAALERAPVETMCARADAAVDAARAAGDDGAIGEALRLSGTALCEAGRLAEAQAAFAEGWHLAERSGTIAAKAALLVDWAMRDVRAGDLDGAHRRLQHALRIAPAGSTTHANTLATLAELSFRLGRLAEARAYNAEAIAAFRALNLRVYLGVACCNAAAYAIAADDLAHARTAVAEALDVLRTTGMPYYVTVAIEHGAVLAALAGDDDAPALLGYTDHAIRRAGRSREQTEAAGFERAVAVLERRLGRAAVAQRLAEGAVLDERRALDLLARTTPEES